MKFRFSNYYEENISQKPFYRRPIFFYILALIFLILAAVLHPFDVEYKVWIQNLRHSVDNSTISSIFDLIKIYGDGTVAIFIAAVIGAMGRKRAAYRIVLAMIIMGVVVGIIKPAVHRERPNHRNDFSFPSGDTATTTALFATLAAELPAFTPAAVILIPGVAIARNWANWHYLSDVLAGIGFGLFAAGLAFKFDIRKNRYIKMVKSRYLALLAVFLTLIFYIPGMLKGSGKFFDFLGVYGIPILVWFTVGYLRMFFNRRYTYAKPVLRITSSTVALIMKFKVRDLKSRILTLCDIVITLLSLLSIVILWSSGLGDIILSLSGLSILLIFSVIYRRYLVKHGKYRKAALVPFITLLYFTLFILISFLPSLIKYTAG